MAVKRAGEPFKPRDAPLRWRGPIEKGNRRGVAYLIYAISAPLRLKTNLAVKLKAQAPL